MSKVWVIYHNETGKEWFVSYSRWLTRIVYHFAPENHTIEFYPSNVYEHYDGMIW